MRSCYRPTGRRCGLTIGGVSGETVWAAAARSALPSGRGAILGVRARRFAGGVVVAVTLMWFWIAVGFYLRRSLLALALALLVVVPCERLFPRHRQQILRPGLLTDLAWVLLQGALELLGTAVGAAVAFVAFAWL